MSGWFPLRASNTETKAIEVIPHLIAEKDPLTNTPL